MTVNIDIKQVLKINPFRRLSEVNEIKLTPSDFCQSYDVNVNASDKKVILGNNKTYYYMHTIESLLNDIHKSI